MDNLLIKFKNLFDKKRLYIILLCGIMLLLAGNLSSSFNKKEDKGAEDKKATVFSDISKEELEKILSQIQGAGKTKVMITYDTSTEKVTIQNYKTDKSSSVNEELTGGEGKEVNSTEERQIVMNGSGNSQTPFIIKEIYPRVRGVLVVCEGANDKNISYNIKNAVAAVLDVPYHKIQVLPKNK